MSRTEINTQTGEVIDVPLTPGELAQAVADALAERKATLKTVVKSEMYRVLKDGFTWQATNADTPFSVCVDPEMEGFLTRTILKFSEGRTDPHGGFLRSNGATVLIDDVGMRELCLFAGMWGDTISGIYIQELVGMETFTDQQWMDYDPLTIDWTVNWSGADASNGWNDNTLTQAP